MHQRSTWIGALCLAALGLAVPGRAATISHTNIGDFSTGVSDGVAMAMYEPASTTAAPQGGVGLLPGFAAAGDLNIDDQFNYTNVAQAQNAGWLFLLPNAQEVPELATNPSEFLFSGDTSATGGTAPSAGFLRLRVSRPQDLLSPADVTTGVPKRQPVLALRNNLVTGDFVAEARFTYEALTADDRRQHGIFIGRPQDGDVANGRATNLTLNDNSVFFFTGPGRLENFYSTARMYPASGNPHQLSTTAFRGNEWTVRVVKRGAYYYSFGRSGDGPWVFHQWVKIPDMAATSADNAVVVGVFGKSFVETGTLTQYRDADFDYFRVGRPGALTGSFSNVMDGGDNANWQTFQIDTQSMQGVKYQLRTGNTVAGGTLTGAGTFVGPDGTANTFFEDDRAQVVPNGNDRRYLEYKLFLDQTPVNLPAYVRLVNATVQRGINAHILSDAPEYGPDAGNIQAQPGGGDLGLARTQIFLDEFNGSLGPGWDPLDPGNTSTEGEATLTERPGYLRLKAGYPQDYDSGVNETGGVKLLREIPAGVTDWEIETELSMEVQQARQAALWVYQDPDNHLGVSVLRRNLDVFEIGLMEHFVLRDTAGGRTPVNYGSNTLQLRLTKRGQIFTLAARDTASPAPSWRILRAINMAGQASGNTDFMPTRVGLLAKSFGNADRGPVNYDFNYFKMSTVAENGAKDVTVTLPTGAKPDSILARGFISAQNTRFQVRNNVGAFVGPDGQTTSFFTTNEPRVSDALAGVTSPTIRVSMDNTTASGTPYLHVLGLQYAPQGGTVVRDSNSADFDAGAVKSNIDTTTTPGVLANAGAVVPGTPQTDELNYSTNDLTVLPWTFDNPVDPTRANSGTSRFSFTDVPGTARLYVGTNEDTAANANVRARAFLRMDNTVSGDWEIETKVSFPNGREEGRITGLGVFQNNAYLFFGPRDAPNSFGTITVRSSAGNGANVANWFDTEYYLRIRKSGQVFTSFARPTAEGSQWTQIDSRTVSTLTNPQVGLYGFSSNAFTPEWPAEFEYFRFTPLVTTATFESRVMDLGASGLTPSMLVEGGNVALIQLQFRAADTPAALASQTYTGPDGTAATFFRGDETRDLPAPVAGKRYVQYRALIPAGASINDVALVVAGATTPAQITREDVATALRIAGGLQNATPAQKARYDVAGGASAGRVDIQDAVQLLRSLPR